MLLATLSSFAAWAFAANKVVEAAIAQIDERGFVLTIGTEPLAVEDQADTHFWKGKAVASREAFKVGDAVTVRIRADRTPVVVREMADPASWLWLERIRKQPQGGTVEKLDDKYLTLRLTDGTQFAYRVTAKSDLVLAGKPAAATDLKPGMKVFVKGRTLPTLDTWVVHLSDQPILAPAKAPRVKRTKTATLPNTGKITGQIVRVTPQLRMFTVPNGGVMIQVGYNAQTGFILDGRSAGPEAIRNGIRVVVAYHRDFVGRIIATKVELFSVTGT